jgi:hypothetical protein
MTAGRPIWLVTRVEALSIEREPLIEPKAKILPPSSVRVS